jgi:hypothetical protein
VVARCVYCKQVIGDREPLEDPSVSHGACDPCVEVALAEWALVRETVAESAASPATGLVRPTAA